MNKYKFTVYRNNGIHQTYLPYHGYDISNGLIQFWDKDENGNKIIQYSLSSDGVKEIRHREVYRQRQLNNKDLVALSENLEHDINYQYASRSGLGDCWTEYSTMALLKIIRQKINRLFYLKKNKNGENAP